MALPGDYTELRPRAKIIIFALRIKGTKDEKQILSTPKEGLSWLL